MTLPALLMMSLLAQYTASRHYWKGSSERSALAQESAAAQRKQAEQGRVHSPPDGDWTRITRRMAPRHVPVSTSVVTHPPH